MRHHAAQAVGMRVTKPDAPGARVGLGAEHAFEENHLLVRAAPSWVRARDFFCFRFCWTARRKFTLGQGAFEPREYVRFNLSQAVLTASCRTSVKHDRNRHFRQFHPTQIPRNPRCVGQCSLPGRTSDNGRVIDAINSTPQGKRWALTKPLLRESVPETSIKQGVELRGALQFHLPPVFRPTRSASLALPPSEG